MAKKSSPQTEQPAPAADAVENSSGFQLVKAIKNKLFSDLEIGEKVKIAGTVRTVETKSGNFGDFEKFTGAFYAKIGETIFSSPVLYLPAVASITLKDSFMRVMENAETPSQAKVEIQLTLYKVENEKSSTGYEWAVELPAPAVEEKSRILALLG